ncbi:MAG: hypothetical protein WDM92_05265 [Caulobacteraceae bacterium]
MRAYTADPLALLTYRDLRRKDGAEALTLVGGRDYKGGVIARARGVDSKEAADALQGLELYALRSALPPAGRGRVLPGRPDRAGGQGRRTAPRSAGSRPCRTSAPATSWRSSRRAAARPG